METQTQKNACRKWQIILGEYVLGTAAERDRVRLERHLRRCESCRRELAEMEEMYRLLGDFELAKPGPFFAAKVDRALRDEATGATAAAPARQGIVAGVSRWMHRHAVASALTAASVATVAAVLYVKVWMPRTMTPEGIAPPASGEIHLKGGKELAGPPAPGDIAAAEERPGASELGLREVPLPVADDGGEGVPALAGTTASDKLDIERTATLAEEPVDLASRGDRGRTALFDEATGDEASPGFFEAEEEYVAEEVYYAAVTPDSTGYVAKRSEERDEATVTAFRVAEATESERAGGAGFGAGFGEGAITASAVECAMETRFSADVERLTRDGTALVDYVTTNGSLMTYFYELPVEEQKTLLSRLRREAESATVEELLFLR
jgi:hypothetical protein